MQSFIHDSLRSRVIFGFGTVERVGSELDTLGVKQAFIVSTRPQAADAQRVADHLGGTAHVFSDATMHTPVEVTVRALAALRSCGADGIVSLGGGSSIGLGKALVARSGLPHLTIPTTYAGSEATPILGETENGAKVTRRDATLLPSVVLYDVNLSLSLPAGLSATSGVNAIAHAAEALYAQHASPLVLIMAEASIAALARALPVIIRQPRDGAARADALYGSWLAGTCLCLVGMALHHKLCHVLGGMFHLPHSETHAVMLPYSMAYNAPAAPDAMSRIARALGCDHAVSGLCSLNAGLGVPRSLAELGMPEAGIEAAAATILKEPYWNPRPVGNPMVERLIRSAYHGSAPGGDL